jgi:BirA family biotin operon repressor/biotin-[acetyl-CoA-carboxylase] ligase
MAATDPRHKPGQGRLRMNSAPELLDLLSADAPVSGATLARRLGVSRAAVWKQIEALRATGLGIEARAGAGYRLARPLDRLDGTAIRRALAAPLRKRLGALEVHWKLDSTSSELQRRVDELPDRAFVFAEVQTAGRGRRGRNWISPPASNLAFSCLKRFRQGYAALSGLSLAVGVAVARALEARGLRGVGVKWPNDLLHHDAKLAGILVELGGEFLGPCQAVIGIGVNLYVPAEARAAIGQPVTDLDELGVESSRNGLAAVMVGHLCDALDAFEASGFAAFASDYARYDALYGRTVRVDDPRGIFEGTAIGVDARGALRVRTAEGEKMVDSAEVSVRAR